MNSDCTISFNNVSKSFGRLRAVQHLDCLIRPGEICGLLGPNGAGKSTTIRMMMSMLYPDSGEISVLGHSAISQRDRIGYLPEERGVYRGMTVGEFITYMAKLKGVPSSGLNKDIKEHLEELKLPDVFNKRCEQLSKGMLQKVQFIASVVHKPILLILDEPFSGLDPIATEEVRAYITRLSKIGTTIILSTHLIDHAEQYCNRFIMINKGCKLLDGTLQEIRRDFSAIILKVETECAVNWSYDDFGNGVKYVSEKQNAILHEFEITHGVSTHEVMKDLISRAPIKTIGTSQITLLDLFMRLVEENASAPLN